MFDLTEQEIKQITDYVDKAEEECYDACHETKSCNECYIQKFIDLITKFKRESCTMIFVIVKLWKNQSKNFDIIEKLIKDNDQLKSEKEQLELKVERYKTLTSETKMLAKQLQQNYDDAFARLKLQQTEIDKLKHDEVKAYENE